MNRSQTAMVIYRSQMHATLKRNYQLMPALKWLRWLPKHIPDKYEHLIRYYGYYSNRARGERRLAEPQSGEHTQVTLDDRAPDRRCKANWARLIQKVYEVDPLECPNCGTAMRIISLIDAAAIIERILRHLKIWDPGSPPIQPAGRDPPWPQGENLQLTYHPVPDIA